MSAAVEPGLSDSTSKPPCTYQPHWRLPTDSSPVKPLDSLIAAASEIVVRAYRPRSQRPRHFQSACRSKTVVVPENDLPAGVTRPWSESPEKNEARRSVHATSV